MGILVSHVPEQANKHLIQVVYLNHGTLSAFSRSISFCSSVNSCAPSSGEMASRRAFSFLHHVDMKRVRKKAMLQTGKESAISKLHTNKKKKHGRDRENYTTYLMNPIRIECPVMYRGPSRERYTYEAMIPPQLPPMTCMAIPVPRFRLPPMFPLFQARPRGIWG